jgi:uncharacterized membrane protein
VIALASLALATLAFVGSHLALSHPYRVRLVQNVGEEWFLLLYSGVALATFGWMVLAYMAVDNSLPLWIAPDWAWTAGAAIVWVASVLLVGSLVRNPAFPNPAARREPPAAPKEAVGVFAITRHPMNWAFMLWALVHFALWGSPRNLIVAGGILILAFVGSIGQDHKKLNVLGEPWRVWMARTSFVPFGALLSGRARWGAMASSWPALLGGTLLWLLVTWFHAPEVSPAAALLR